MKKPGMLGGMSERIEETRALHSAIGDFARLAQDLGRVQLANNMNGLVITGVAFSTEQKLASHTIATSRVVTILSREQPNDRPLIAMLNDDSPISSLLVTAEVSKDVALGNIGSQAVRPLLPQPQLRALRNSVEAATPKHVEPVEAELLFERIAGGVALRDL